MTTGVYQITCIPTGKRYIGSSCNVEGRWKDHCAKLNRNCHYNFYLQRAWNKYGQSVFGFEMLEECRSGQEKIREQRYLDIEKPEFNILPDACGFSKGHKLTLKTRGRISRAHQGRKHTTESRFNMANAQLGRRHSLETKTRMSNSAKGHEVTKKTRTKLSATLKRRWEDPKERVKLSAAMKGRVPWNKGEKSPPETCAKMSVAKKGENHPMYGKKHALETRIKMSLSWSPERRAKQAEMMRRHHARQKAEKAKAAAENQDG